MILYTRQDFTCPKNFKRQSVYWWRKRFLRFAMIEEGDFEREVLRSYIIHPRRAAQSLYKCIIVLWIDWNAGVVAGYDWNSLRLGSQNEIGCWSVRMWEVKTVARQEPCHTTSVFWPFMAESCFVLRVTSMCLSETSKIVFTDDTTTVDFRDVLGMAALEDSNRDGSIAWRASDTPWLC